MTMKQFILIIATVLAVGVSAHADKPSKPQFKMLLRLWCPHHDDPKLAADLIKALKQYPHFCDEVWFETEPIEQTLDEHEQSAKRMAKMADEMRRLGIIPSLQLVAFGHPEGPNAEPLKGITWSTAVGRNGEVTRRQNCPRQKPYLEKLTKIYEIYAREAKPSIAWIDDDLRLTMHSPANEICYCDTCIAEFNREHGTAYTRQSLVAALDDNVPGLRRQWIEFGQQSLAGVAAAIARGFHNGCDTTRMGLQAVNFQRNFLEGYDWNPILNAMQKETGLISCLRPGHGYYEDHAPRGMLEKGIDISRQVRRLDPNVSQIAPEIEGYIHKATGKSPHGICVETMYYLAMGATQMSYAIICANWEPMQWYADNYFKALQSWHAFAKEYADWNWGSEPVGIDPYLSPNFPYRNLGSGEGSFGWAYTGALTEPYALAAIGFPFSPDCSMSPLRMLDAAATVGITDSEFSTLLSQKGMIMDQSAWNELENRQLTTTLTKVATPAELTDVTCYTSPSGKRIAVVPSFSADISGGQRLNLLRVTDWASAGTMPAIIESMAQSALIPRLDRNGNLRSVAILNCSISNQEFYTVRLRTGGKKHKFIWKKNGLKDVVLKATYSGDDAILQVPNLEGWNFGWIQVK